MKIWKLADSKSFYVYNNESILEEEALHPKLLKENVSWRNYCRHCSDPVEMWPLITFFTSIPLEESLLHNNLTLTGTIRSNKRELPPEFRANSQRPQHAVVVFGFAKRMTLCSYVPKRRKSVWFFSRPNMDELNCLLEKIESVLVILDPNSCKGAVHTVDQMITTYLCAGYKAMVFAIVFPFARHCCTECLHRLDRKLFLLEFRKEFPKMPLSHWSCIFTHARAHGTKRWRSSITPICERSYRRCWCSCRKADSSRKCIKESMSALRLKKSREIAQHEMQRL